MGRRIITGSGDLWTALATYVYRTTLLIIVLTVFEFSAAAMSDTPGALPGIVIASLAIDPQNSNILYAGTPNGVFRSADGGTSWSGPGAASPAQGPLEPDPKSSGTLYTFAYSNRENG